MRGHVEEEVRIGRQLVDRFDVSGLVKGKMP
jgi:hypothetical protein